MLYNESDSYSSDNIQDQDSYNQVFGHEKKKNIAIGSTKNFASTDKYDIAKVKNNMLNNFGNSMGGGGFGNFGNTGQLGNMVGPFNNAGFGNDIYNINLDFDKDKYKDEDKKKKEKENVEEKKSFRESTESKKENKFMKDIEDEIGLESSMNKTPYGSKIDFTEQSQKGSKVNKEEKGKAKKESEEIEKEEVQDEEKEIEDDKNNAIVKENDNEDAEDKQKKMEEYMKSHQPKINWGENKNIKPENENDNDVIKTSVIEEQINSNIENSHRSKENSKKGEEDDYDEYGGFENVNSIAVNTNNDYLNSLIPKKNEANNKKSDAPPAKQTNESNNTNTNKYLASSESKYEGEFGQSNLDQVKELEDKNKSSVAVESMINQLNSNEHKNQNLPNLNSQITNKEEQIPNIYSNNNLINSNNINNNINSNNNVFSSNNNNIKSNNFINSIGSGDSVNVKNIIRNEVKKYDNDIPGYKKNDDINQKFIPGSSINENNYQFNNIYPSKNYKFSDSKLREIHSLGFSFYKASKVQVDLLKLKNDEALKQERRKRENVEIELQFTKEKYSNLLKEFERINNQKNQDFEELKYDYENRIKSIENNINSREVQKAQNLIKDLENKHQTDIIKKENEIHTLKNDYQYLENRYKILEEENRKLKDMNEKDEEIHELKAEIYRLHEENNELKQKRNIASELLSKNNNNNNNNDENNNKKSDTTQVYEQLLNEREINTQENLLNNYLKEIKKLNEEIIFLKSFQSGNKSGVVGPKQKNNLNNVEMTLNNINYKKNNNNYVINPSLQESAEKQIKKLQNYLLPSSPNDVSENKMILMEKEFNRLQNKESPNEITFDNFLAVMKRLQVPLTSNELIEIFNNFPRVKGNRIRMNDFINALNSKVPSAFFLQSDPTYLNELESKLIKSQNRVKELEKFILVNNNENEEFKEQLKKSMNENKLLKNKINELNSQILQYFLFREEKNMSNPDVIQMKEKMKNFELKNKTMNNELSEKFGKYEKKIEELKKTYEDERINLLKEKDGFKDEINKLKNEKEKVKNEFDKKEIKYKSEIDQLNEKLIKYKKNYNILINKNEINKKEKEKILNSFKDKGFDPDQIMTYVNSSANIQEILNKIEDLERKNLNREELYKKICMDVNKTQINKELEKIKTKHEEEKRGLLKIIAQKNNELNSIKSEFFGIMTELERLKASKFK